MVIQSGEVLDAYARFPHLNDSEDSTDQTEEGSNDGDGERPVGSAWSQGTPDAETDQHEQY